MENLKRKLDEPEISSNKRFHEMESLKRQLDEPEVSSNKRQR